MTDTPNTYFLHQITATLMSVRESLIADDPDLAHDEAALAELMQGEGLDLLDNVLRAAIHAKDMADAADERARQIIARRDRFKRRSETLRRAAFAAMDALGLTKRQLPDMTVSVGRGVASVVITDETAIPEQYLRVRKEVDKSALKADLQEGVVIPGAELSNGMPSMRIHTR